jgi:ATP-dependent DNA helicase DinG
MSSRTPRDPRSDPLGDLLGPSGLLAQELEGYEPRPAQLDMARRVARCFDEDTRLIVEAGTGTGKTLAYLLPALLSGKKVVVSTGTKTLQGQIFEKDLPFLLGRLESFYGLTVEVACMKGLSNFLCRRRFEERRRSAQVELFRDTAFERLVRWAARTRTGDRAELEELQDDSPIWAEVSSSSETRLGAPCRYYEECFVTAMRRRAAAARLVVVNHHLLFADLALRARAPEAGVIPPHDALVLDEAHQLEAIATSHFGTSVSLQSLERLVRDARRALRVARDGSAGEALAQRVQGSAAELFHLLERRLGPRASARDDAASSQRQRLDAPPLEGELRGPALTLDAALEALAAHLSGSTGAPAPPEDPEEAMGREELAAIAGRADETRDALAVFGEREAEGTVLWWERPRSGLALHASPIEVGPILARTLFASTIPVVLTSATLSTGPAPAPAPAPPRPTSREHGPAGGGFDYFRTRVGLDADAPVTSPLPVEELCLPSPFCFEEQALLYLPQDLPDPREPAFVQRAVERAAQLIDLAGGRTLFLFTSHRNLRAARALLDGRLAFPLLCQGDSPRGVLLEVFRRDVSSVLLATSSFWEGVDIRGESCSLVIIDKLPFASPEDPLTSARIEREEERGADPFSTLQLPRAAIALKQGFGRLIRARSDRGVVAILDRRVRARVYGRVLLASLPPCPFTSDLLRVRGFFQGTAFPPAAKARPRTSRPPAP